MNVNINLKDLTPYINVATIIHFISLPSEQFIVGFWRKRAFFFVE